MASASQRFWKTASTVVVLASAAVASACAGSPHSLQKVNSSNPSVTYSYGNDQELLQAQEDAATFCSRYNSTPTPAKITSNPNGATKDVTYECAPNVVTTAVPAATVNPNLTYTYRTDQELLAASQTAETYCSSHGSQRALSTITSNPDGSRTVVFRCTPA
jgi:hypothetical protein